MAEKTIITIGDELLRKKSHPVTKFDLRLQLMIRDMFQTMYKANGVGLAAPQIGILRRLIVVDTGDEQPMALVNPTIVSKEGSCSMVEGCLSVPERRGVVTRPEKVTVTYQDKKGEAMTLEAEGLLARALQHEIDHLDGVLYVDKMDEEVPYDEDEEWDDSEDET